MSVHVRTPLRLLVWCLGGILSQTRGALTAREVAMYSGMPTRDLQAVLKDVQVFFAELVVVLFFCCDLSNHFVVACALSGLQDERDEAAMLNFFDDLRVLKEKEKAISAILSTKLANFDMEQNLEVAYEEGQTQKELELAQRDIEAEAERIASFEAKRKSAKSKKLPPAKPTRADRTPGSSGQVPSPPKRADTDDARAVATDAELETRLAQVQKELRDAMELNFVDEVAVLRAERDGLERELKQRREDASVFAEIPNTTLQEADSNDLLASQMLGADVRSKPDAPKRRDFLSDAPLGMAMPTNTLENELSVVEQDLKTSIDLKLIDDAVALVRKKADLEAELDRRSNIQASVLKEGQTQDQSNDPPSAKIPGNAALVAARTSDLEQKLDEAAKRLRESIESGDVQGAVDLATQQAKIQDELVRRKRDLTPAPPRRQDIQSSAPPGLDPSTEVLNRRLTTVSGALRDAMELNFTDDIVRLRKQQDLIQQELKRRTDEEAQFSELERDNAKATPPALPVRRDEAPLGMDVETDALEKKLSSVARQLRIALQNNTTAEAAALSRTQARIENEIARRARAPAPAPPPRRDASAGPLPGLDLPTNALKAKLLEVTKELQDATELNFEGDAGKLSKQKALIEGELQRRREEESQFSELASSRSSNENVQNAPPAPPPRKDIVASAPTGLNIETEELEEKLAIVKQSLREAVATSDTVAAVVLSKQEIDFDSELRRREALGDRRVVAPPLAQNRDFIEAAAEDRPTPPPRIGVMMPTSTETLARRLTQVKEDLELAITSNAVDDAAALSRTQARIENEIARRARAPAPAPPPRRDASAGPLPGLDLPTNALKAKLLEVTKELQDATELNFEGDAGKFSQQKALIEGELQRRREEESQFSELASSRSSNENVQNAPPAPPPRKDIVASAPTGLNIETEELEEKLNRVRDDLRRSLESRDTLTVAALSRQQVELELELQRRDAIGDQRVTPPRPPRRELTSSGSAQQTDDGTGASENVDNAPLGLAGKSDQLLVELGTVQKELRKSVELNLVEDAVALSMKQAAIEGELRRRERASALNDLPRTNPVLKARPTGAATDDVRNGAPRGLNIPTVQLKRRIESGRENLQTFVDAGDVARAVALAREIADLQSELKRREESVRNRQSLLPRPTSPMASESSLRQEAQHLEQQLQVVKKELQDARELNFVDDIELYSQQKVRLETKLDELNASLNASNTNGTDARHIVVAEDETRVTSIGAERRQTNEEKLPDGVPGAEAFFPQRQRRDTIGRADEVKRLERQLAEVKKELQDARELNFVEDIPVRLVPALLMCAVLWSLDYVLL